MLFFAIANQGREVKRKYTLLAGHAESAIDEGIHQMLGAIAGDMIGSPYEGHPVKSKKIPLIVSNFTDDTVLTIAVARAILNQTDFAEPIKALAQKYHHLPYGGSFSKWMWTRANRPYNSFGNGSAMRVSPVGFAYDAIDKVLLEAKRSAEVTHNHPEGIKGAQATALAILMARQGESKTSIRSNIMDRFGYDLNRSLDSIRPTYEFDVSCQGSVPESIIAFLESESYADAIKNAISLGGDADTMACIAGGISQAYYKKMPADIIAQVRDTLPNDLLSVLNRFNDQYNCPH
jgi:ADP-ribosylglycohydrolase